MSGIDVAGLVIGVLPIVVKAFKEARKRYRFMRNMALYMDRISEALLEQHFLLCADLLHVLKDAGVPPAAVARVQELAAGGNTTGDGRTDLGRASGATGGDGGAAGENGSNQDMVDSAARILTDSEILEDVQDHLNQLLPQGYERYIKCLKTCEASVADVAKYLIGLTGTTLSPDKDPHIYLRTILTSNSTQAGGYFWLRTAQKLKFVFSKSGIDERLAELDQATKTLRRLNLAATSEAAGASGLVMTMGGSGAGGGTAGTAGTGIGDMGATSSRKFGRLADLLYFTGRYARLLYNAIMGVARCQCHGNQCVHLFLESTPALMQKRKGVRPIFDIELGGRQGLQQLRHLERSCQSQHQRQHQRQQQRRLWHRGWVQVIENERGLNQNVTRPTVVSITVNASQAAEKEEVHSLCKTISNAQQDHNDISLFLSDGELVYSKQQEGETSGRTALLAPRPTVDFITLEEVFNHNGVSEVQMVKWSVSKRMTLAAMLCAAAIQFSTTWWLDAPWKASSVYFPKTLAGGLASSGKGGAGPTSKRHTSIAGYPTTTVQLPFEPEKPFIRRADMSAASEIQSAKSVLLDLGILLMELWHQTSLDTFASFKGIELGGSFGSRYDAAKLWLEEDDDNMLPFYYFATQRCIEASFSIGPEWATFDWEDATLRKSVCEHVLKPLCEHCPLAMKRGFQTR